MHFREQFILQKMFYLRSARQNTNKLGPNLKFYCNVKTDRIFAKLSPSPSSSWAELALISADPRPTGPNQTGLVLSFQNSAKT